MGHVVVGRAKRPLMAFVMVLFDGPFKLHHGFTMRGLRASN